MRVPWLTEMEGSDSHRHLGTLSLGTYLLFVSSKGFGESMLSYLLLTGIQLANTFLLSDPGPKYSLGPSYVVMNVHKHLGWLPTAHTQVQTPCMALSLS